VIFSNRFLQNRNTIVAAIVFISSIYGNLNAFGQSNQLLRNNNETNSYTTGIQYMKLLLKDGSQFLINPDDILISVKTEYGRWDMPVGALRALKFLSSPGSDEPDATIVRFHTGLVRRMQLSSRKNYIRTRDKSGNRLKVYYRDILGILCSTDFNSNASEPSASDESTGTFNAVMKDGTTKTISIPVAVWKLGTPIGSLLIPSPMVSGIRKTTESKYKYEFTTIYGEIIPGNFPGRKIRIISENKDGYSDIGIGDFEQIISNSKDVATPDKWLVWYLKSGLAIIGSFAAPSQETFTDGGIKVKPGDIFRLTPQIDGSFLCVSRNGQTKNCRPISSKVKVALLSTGQTVDILWRDVCLVKYQKQVSETVLRNQVAASVFFDDKKKLNEREKENLKLRTAIGTMNIEPGNIAAIAIDKTKSKACVSTVYGDRFIVSVPSISWLKKLQNIDDYELPEDEIFEIKLRDFVKPDKTANSAVCRLITGDILHGILPKQELEIRIGDNRKSTKISTTDLQQIVRDQNGLTFISEQGEVAAAPKQSKIEFVLPAFGSTNRVSFRQIETMVTGNRELPPTTVFTPGMTAYLKDEIFVKQGSFMQGNPNGMDDEKPVHHVLLKAFYIDSTEVTRAQFSAFTRDSGYETTAEQTDSPTTWSLPGFIQGRNDPAVCLSWHDAVSYCNWRSSKTGLTPCYTINRDKSVITDRTASGYRLPTEAEWEYAARNLGKDNLYACNSGSTNPANILANYKDSSTNDKWRWTNPVREFPPNELGIYGLSGNVWEWCEDWYFDKAYASLQNRKTHNPCITPDNAPVLNRRVMRGGSFRNNREWLRCTSRGNGPPYAFSNHVGFRCVRNAL